MAERRMFTKKITDDDVFTSMPPTAQCLYFHLCMHADDDGFSNNVRLALFNSHASTDDFNTLIGKRFIIPFDSGVIVIRHWRMHNYIQKDRKHDTEHTKELSDIVLQKNGVYELAGSGSDTECIQKVSNMLPEVSIGKDSIGQNRGEKKPLKRFTPPSREEVAAYCRERGNKVDPDRFVDFYSSKGWMVGKNPMKDWKAAVRGWEKESKQKAERPPNRFAVKDQANTYDFADLERKARDRQRV